MADMKKDKPEFDMPITRAVNNAARQVLQDEAQRKEKNSKRREGCLISLGGAIGHLWNGWMLMFAVALVGFPLGYWPCVLIAYVVSCLIGTGNWSMAVNVAKIQKRFEK